MNAPIPQIDFMTHADAEASLKKVAAGLRAGAIVPYLGPGLAELARPAVPTNPEALAAFFGTKVALPRRAKGNAWAAAQHIESMKHRSTVTALMSEAFSSPVAPTPLHRYRACKEFPDFRRRLCRGADGNRHPDAPSGCGQGSPYRAQLCLHRLSLQRS